MGALETILAVGASLGTLGQTIHKLGLPKTAKSVAVLIVIGVSIYSMYKLGVPTENKLHPSADVVSRTNIPVYFQNRSETIKILNAYVQVCHDSILSRLFQSPEGRCLNIIYRSLVSYDPNRTRGFIVNFYDSNGNVIGASASDSISQEKGEFGNKGVALSRMTKSVSVIIRD